MRTKNGRIGYACLDLTCDESFRTCRLKTFNEKGLIYISSLCLYNAKVLYGIIERNAKSKIAMYRITSNLMPWNHLYKPNDLLDWDEIHSIYKRIGALIKMHDMRVSFHPDHYTVLGSENPKVVENAIHDLNHHSFLLDLIDAPNNPYAKINIHISNTKPSKREAIARFIENYHNLDENTKRRLTIENDDNINGYTVEDLLEVYEQIGTPIVFDTLHYNCNKGNLSYEAALVTSAKTWHDIVPTMHHSSSKTIEDPKAVVSAHSDYIHHPFDYCGLTIDVMLEAKAKNLALQKYYKDFIVI